MVWAGDPILCINRSERRSVDYVPTTYSRIVTMYCRGSDATGFVFRPHLVRTSPHADATLRAPSASQTHLSREKERSEGSLTAKEAVGARTRPKALRVALTRPQHGNESAVRGPSRTEARRRSESSTSSISELIPEISSIIVGPPCDLCQTDPLASNRGLVKPSRSRRRSRKVETATVPSSALT